MKEAIAQISSGFEAPEVTATVKESENVKPQEASEVYVGVMEVKPQEQSTLPTAE